VREAAACLYLSELERREYLAQGADPGSLHPLPPPLDLPDPGEVERADVPTVLYLGQLHPIKRIGALLDAFELVRRELPDARLEIVGAPSRHGEALQVRAGAGVTFHGLIPEEEKAAAFARAQVFALLSAAEGLPVTVLEALSCGTPVVLSPGCGLPELDGVAGIVTNGSAESASQALLAVLRDPELAHRYGQAGRSFAASYRREVVVPEFVALLERVVTSSSSAA
jgi:glycosyltransferase involved in cell wall biosynthesis